LFHHGDSEKLNQKLKMMLEAENQIHMM